ncbi:unnamed protein product [Eruca vesicaria subsp. sativa]|uniref:Exonuclease domain-containing protein n=1 Tax=Eruca vesicaria subsp. sativa TaxID=29727 RepID=A0ABC8JRP4_ERUVS|nr:unnamed protein product [Eruca vesicaria subsp. sativa]
MTWTCLFSRLRTHTLSSFTRRWRSTLVSDERNEIAFLDLETTVPTKAGQPVAIIEFGDILVCPKTLSERYSYSTLVRPTDPSLISTLSKRRSGITREGVLSAPTFAEISHLVYDNLNGESFYLLSLSGHNIKRFDIPRLREAYAEISQPPPEPKAIIDTLPLLTHKFGKRAGDMKMASLARYFGLGNQTHRSLDDARMTLEVLKLCATVSLLRSIVPDILAETIRLSPSDTSCCEPSDSSDVTTLISKTHIETDKAKNGRQQQDESTPSPDPDAKDEALLKLKLY